MKIYRFTRIQQLPISLEKAWAFFSDPVNLEKITPSRMNFRIITNSSAGMYEGQIIKYKVNIFPMYTVDWVSEITNVSEPFHFVDEQRIGPYTQWRHEHRFKTVSGGIEMTDDVKYAIPFGWIGRFAKHALCST